jgi:hypothetical protein
LPVAGAAVAQGKYPDQVVKRFVALAAGGAATGWPSPHRAIVNQINRAAVAAFDAELRVKLADSSFMPS